MERDLVVLVDGKDILSSYELQIGFSFYSERLKVMQATVTMVTTPFLVALKEPKETYVVKSTISKTDRWIGSVEALGPKSSTKHKAPRYMALKPGVPKLLGPIICLANNTGPHLNIRIEHQRKDQRLLVLRSLSAGHLANILLRAREQAIPKYPKSSRVLQIQRGPVDWKLVNVPVFKKGKKKDPGNDRSVSLISVPGKKKRLFCKPETPQTAALAMEAYICFWTSADHYHNFMDCRWYTEHSLAATGTEMNPLSDRETGIEVCGSGICIQVVVLTGCEK
ncbi:hypothetical protein WISP_78580 [Willisornis vidua]|uniref:Uncharacterized protein n=1 Tax=Willisornis vidua TaxID=1566151 RepID=A0ABQ9DB83_9PASS|nr:hypothetical protein WISP_78580 [Willisornis vidua]